MQKYCDAFCVFVFSFQFHVHIFGIAGVVKEGGTTLEGFWPTNVIGMLMDAKNGSFNMKLTSCIHRICMRTYV